MRLSPLYATKTIILATFFILFHIRSMVLIKIMCSLLLLSNRQPLPADSHRLRNVRPQWPSAHAFPLEDIDQYTLGVAAGWPPALPRRLHPKQ